ncbi:MAG: UdgX family uracil-DNA binding protein [Nocardioidaceae bacterium]
MPERPTLDRLREAAQACRGCELHEAATQAVVGVGPVDAAMMLVGEQPGDQEDLAGRPFVGPAGRLLDKALQAAGIEPEGVFVTNAVKHFRFSGTKGKRRIHASPGRVHIAACQPWLLAELDLVTPHGVVLLGASCCEVDPGIVFQDH